MFPQFGNGVGLGKLFAHPRLREADIGWSQCFRALRLDLIHNPQVDFQKRTHGVRILFRERAIRDKEYGLRCTAILRMRRNFEPERFGFAGERRPDGEDIAVPVLERAEGGCRFQFLDLDVLLLKPERGEPFVEQIAGRRFFGAQDELALDGFGRPEDIREIGIESLFRKDRAIGAGQDHVGRRFVVGDGNHFHLIAHGGLHGGNRPATGDGPIVGPDVFDEALAGIEPEHDDVQSGFLVPAFFLCVPCQKRLVLAKPCRTEGFGQGGRRLKQAAEKRAYCKQCLESHNRFLCVECCKPGSGPDATRP